jgi:hypothetical protein
VILKIVVFWHVMPSNLVPRFLHSSEMFVPINQTTRYHIPEDLRKHTSIMSHVLVTISGVSIGEFIDYLQDINNCTNNFYTIADFHTTNHSALSLLSSHPLVSKLTNSSYSCAVSSGNES